MRPTRLLRPTRAELRLIPAPPFRKIALEIFLVRERQIQSYLPPVQPSLNSRVEIRFKKPSQPLWSYFKPGVCSVARATQRRPLQDALMPILNVTRQTLPFQSRAQIR